MRHCCRLYHESVARNRAGSGQSTSGKLYDGVCPKRRCESPRLDRVTDLYDTSRLGHERDVNREPHEPGVDGARWSDHDGVAFRQAFVFEQARASCLGIECRDYLRRDHATVSFIPNAQFGSILLEQRPNKSF